MILASMFFLCFLLDDSSGTKGWGTNPKADCGVACLYTLLVAYSAESPVGYTTFLSDAEIDKKKGISLDGLSNLATRYSLHSLPVSVDIKNLASLSSKYGVIASVKKDHFVLVDHLGHNYAELIDPNLGSYRLNLSEFQKHFNGPALLVSNEPIVLEESRNYPSWIWLCSGLAVTLLTVFAIRLRKHSGAICLVLTASSIIGCNNRESDHATLKSQDASDRDKKETGLISNRADSIQFSYTLEYGSSSETEQAVEGRLIDLGETPRVPELRINLYLQNPTKSQIQIGSIVQSCLCTAVHCSETTIPAGGKVEVALKLRGQGSRPLKSAVSFNFETPRHSTQTLTLAWRPRPIVEFENDWFEIGVLNDEEGGSFATNVHWAKIGELKGTDTDFKIIASPRGILNCEFSDDKNRVLVKVKSGMKHITEGSIVIVDSSENELAHSGVSWTWKSDLALGNRCFVYPNATPESTSKIELIPGERVKDRGWGIITSIESKIDGLSLSVEGNRAFLCFRPSLSTETYIESVVSFQVEELGVFTIPVVAAMSNLNVEHN